MVKSFKFDFKILLAVLCMVTLIVGCTVAVCFAIPSDNIALADSSNGVVEDNFFINPTMSNTGSSTSYSGTVPNFIQDWSLAYGTVSWVDGVLTHTNSGSTWQGIYYNFLNYEQGATYTFTAYGYASVGTFRLYAYDYSTGSRVNIGSVNNSSDTEPSVLSLTFTVPSSATDIRLFVYGAEGSCVFHIYWVKLEKSSTFTGYVPKDYTNYGYNQGYNAGYSQGFIEGVPVGYHNGKQVGYSDGYDDGYSAGLDAYDISRYNLLDYIGFNGLDTANGTFYNEFDYGGRHYYTNGGVNWKILNNNSYNIISLLPNNNNYVGIKYSNDKLYGSILIRMVWTSNLSYAMSLVFVDTVTTETLVVTSADTLHFKYLGDLGYAYNANNVIVETAYLAEITYYSDNPVDLYFLPTTPIANDNNLEYVLDFPYDASTGVACIYASMDENFVYSYDDGYKAGYSQAQVNQSSLINNARSSGYHQGYSEGLQQSNQYTFIGLLGSVVDAPLQALFGKYDEVTQTRVGGLFNVNILGVDMTAFFTALLSLMLVIAVVRIALKVAIG